MTALSRIGLLLATALASAPAAIPPAMAPPPMEDAAAYANRLIFYPITSFYINGVNGMYERRLSHGHFGFGIPFYLGRLEVTDAGRSTTWGGGLEVAAFPSTRPSGFRFSASFELIDVRQEDVVFLRYDPDPSFPNPETRSWDVYHRYLEVFSVVGGYRWEFPSHRFLMDLGLGASYLRFRGPDGGDAFEPPPRLNGFLPLARFAVGIPF